VCRIGRSVGHYPRSMRRKSNTHTLGRPNGSLLARFRRWSGGFRGSAPMRRKAPADTAIAIANALLVKCWQSAHFWTRSKQPWITLPEGDQIFETQPAT
jgi:hypothetical protein